MDHELLADVTGFLGRKPPLAWHELARMLEVDGDALKVLAWIAAQPDCDTATAAIIFWRVRGLDGGDIPQRRAVLEAIAARDWGAARIAWDGIELWDRVRLIDAPALAGLEVVAPTALLGPFGSEEAEPPGHVLLDPQHHEYDLFDSMWRVSPRDAAVVDWLPGKSPEQWIAMAEAIYGAHPSDLFEWMVRQPECADAVAGRLFWMSDPGYHAEALIEGREWRGEGYETCREVLRRWRAGDLVPSDLDFSRQADGDAYRAVLARHPGHSDPLDIPADLLDPAPGRVVEPVNPYLDYRQWFAIAQHSYGSSNFRAELAGQQQASIEGWERSRRDALAREAERNRPPGLLDRVFYGGKFTGAQAQMDRAWRGLIVVTLAGGALVLALWRLGAPTMLGFGAFLALTAIVSLWLSAAKIGGALRHWGYWGGVTVAALGLAMLFRWIDKGVF